MTRHRAIGTRVPQETIGCRADGTPIWPVLGGDGGVTFEYDDEEDEDDRPRGGKGRRRQADPDDEPDDDDADDEPDDEPDDRPDDGWQPPSQSEWQRLQDELARASAEAKQRRLLLRKAGLHHRTGRPLTQSPPDDEPDEQPDEPEQPDGASAQQSPAATRAAIKKAEQRGQQRAEAAARLTYEPALVALAAEAALNRAGWSGQNIELALRLVRLDELDVEVSDDGRSTVHGLDDEITKIKAEFPSWFRRRVSGEEPPKRRRRINGARELDGGEREAPPTAGQSWLERVAESLDR